VRVTTTAPGAALDGLQALEIRCRYDPVGAAAEGERLLADGSVAPDSVDGQRLRLLRVVQATRGGHVDEALRAIGEVAAWALEHQERYLRARCERLTSVAFRRLGEVSTSLEHAVTALDLLDADVHPGVRADHVLGLADALATNGALQDARQRYEEAYEYARQVQDTRLSVLVLNNLAFCLQDLGQSEAAVQVADRMRKESALAGLTLPLHALDTVAATYIGAGRFAEAVDLLSPQSFDASTVISNEELLEARVTLARALRGLGRLDEAEHELLGCSAQAQAWGMGSFAIATVGELALVHAARGEYQRAFELHQEFHRRTLSQHAADRDARARMMQAIFETAEARRESARFREMSYRDPLTRLYNRRYVDEHLTGVLESAVAEGAAVSVAFVDLDFFKRINDTCSHEVGDEVLRRVGRLLDAAATRVAGAFAARMGGEEFLLVLPGTSNADAAPLLEALRGQVESAAWTDITRGLPVTASIGCATATADGGERLTLLACADQRLYAAKRTGRNKVVFGDEP
jgi:two-component system, cell cycle response regulator